MKKIVFVLLSVCLGYGLQAQVASADSVKKSSSKESKPKKIALPKKDWSKVDLSNRTADHFMIQYGGTNWSNTPDSIRIGSGFSRHFNFYFMLDKPFKSNPKLSVAYGAGFGTNHVFFDRQYVDLKATSARLPFRSGLVGTDSSNFDKFKLTTIYLEIPVEIRFFSNPENTAKSWKAALGVKVGTLFKSYTKGKNLETKTGASVYGPSYIAKESNRRFMNGTRLSFNGRVGYGIFSLHGEYNILGVLKDGVGVKMNSYNIGVTISGL
jgi:Outer membrane protein beta-barrel domain